MPGIDQTPGGIQTNNCDLLYDQFVQAGTFQGIFKTFFELCEELNLKPFAEHRNFYQKFKSQLTSWKADSLWSKLDKRFNRKEYKKGKACSNTNVFIIGAGPCGLRTAIECAMLGAKVVIVEKRLSFSRNNVLHLWPFLITDLRNLGAKKFFGKFCAGSIDHISIRQLQVVLLKVALIMGVEIHYGVSFEGLEVPPEDQEHEKIGWRAKLEPKDHPVSEYEFDVIVGADGRRNTLHGFKRKEFRGKLAIAITANFINRKSNEEASVEEISGVAFIFNQKFFQDLREQTGIDLENIVYYKDETHYFVMTAKKQSLLSKKVILKDLPDTNKLLRADNYSHQRLQEYAREAADFCTNFQLPTLDYALNHHGKPDVAMFDFTSIYAAENAARVLDRNGHKLLLALVGDSLLEPIWPTGSGCARGFLGAFDAAWMIRSWASGVMSPLEVLAERESSYRLLAQTTPENLCKVYESYGINPNSRYPHLNTRNVAPQEVIHLYDTLDEDLKAQFEILEKKPSMVLNRTASVVRSSKVLMWCQRVTANYLNVMVENMTSSWRNGLALCAIIHRYRPHLIDYNSLRPENVVENNQLAFDIAEREFGIPPVMTGKEMASIACPDKLTIVAYVLRFYDLFKDELPASHKQENNTKEIHVEEAHPPQAKSSIPKSSLLSRLASKVRRKSHEKHDKENAEKAKASASALGSKRKHHKHKDAPSDDIIEKRKLITQGGEKSSENGGLNVAAKNELNVGVRGQNKVSGLAEQLQANLRSNFGMDVRDGPRPKPKPLIDTGNVQASQLCVFCSKRVYVMERLSAEGLFFHRDCFKCQDCDVTIRIGNYAYLPDQDGGKGRFLCREHFAARKQAARKRSLSDKEREAVKSKKQVFSFDSIDEVVEDENENISHPEPTTPKTPKTPKTPFRKRSLLSPFFGKRSKTTPERDEMQKMYERIAESKGALTEEEQARYNLGTSVNTDDELDESSDSEFDEEEKAWLAKEGISTKRGSSKRKKGSGKKKAGTPSNLKVPSDLSIPDDDLSPTSDVPPCSFDGGIPRSESSSKEKKSRLSRMRMDLPRRRDATKATKSGRRTSSGLQQMDDLNKDNRALQRSASTKVDSSRPLDGAIPKQRKSKSLKLKKRVSAGKLMLSSTEGDSDREERPLSPSSLDLPLGQFGEEGARLKRKVPDVVAGLGVGTPEAAATEQLPRLIKKLSVDASLTGDIDIDSTSDEDEIKRDEGSTDPEPSEQITDSPRSKNKSPRRMWGKRFKEKRKMEEEELSARLTKRVQKEARRQHHQQQLKRHRLAQEIQRQLQEVEVKQHELENRGVAAERALRGEETPEGVDETTLMQEWFSLVNEKNALVRFETELMVQARELELEDRHSQLEQELRLIMAVGEGKKTASDRDQEKLLLDEMLEVVEQRDALVAFLEEERLKEQQEDQDFEAIMLKKGLMTAVR